MSSRFDYINLSNCRFPRVVTNPRNSSEKFLVPCRHCANCRIKRRSKLETMANFELLDCYQRGLSASFVTLTYSPDYVPVKAFGVKSRQPIMTLDYKDLKRFMNRVHSRLYDNGFNAKYKYIACGEYGPENGQPHYHIAYMGVAPALLEKYVRECWHGRGIIDFGPLSSGGIRYIISYLDVAIGGRKAYELYNKCGCEPPKVIHSKNLGVSYVYKHLKQFQKYGMSFNSKGTLVPLPKSVRNRFGVFDYQIPDSVYLEQSSRAYAVDMDVISYLKNKSYLQEYDNINKMRLKGVPFSSQSLYDTPFNNNSVQVSSMVKEAII